MPSNYPVRPPWPQPADLAPAAQAPPMEDKESFTAHAIRTWRDEFEYASLRWEAARRLMLRGEIGRALLSKQAPSDGDPPTDKSTPSPAEARTLAAWLMTPRESFVPASTRRETYLSHAMPIGHGQTISAPYMVTRMTAALNPAPHDAVLEIGTGSGYQAALLAAMTGKVHTIETVGPLAVEAGRHLEALAERRPWLENLRRRTGNGYAGWPERAPFDRIIVTCAIDHIPPALMEQCAPGGIIVLPLGEPRVQRLLALRRRRSEETGPPGRAWSEVERTDASPAGYAWDARDVYGDGTRVVFVPFVY